MSRQQRSHAARNEHIRLHAFNVQRNAEVSRIRAARMSSVTWDAIAPDVSPSRRRQSEASAGYTTEGEYRAILWRKRIGVASRTLPYSIGDVLPYRVALYAATRAPSGSVVIRGSAPVVASLIGTPHITWYAAMVAREAIITANDWNGTRMDVWLVPIGEGLPAGEVAPEVITTDLARKHHDYALANAPESIVAFANRKSERI